MSYRILIVDDEPDLEQLIKQKFRKQIRKSEFEFAVAFNGLEALNILKNDNTIDAVLTDINMPQMDGLTLLKRIREMNNPILKAVVISAYGDMENIRKAMNHGAFDFVTKPINFEDLEITINKTLGEISKLKQAEEVKQRDIAMRQEMEIAKNIQLSILPQPNPTVSERTEFEIAARIIPAKEVGGDFYDYFMIDKNRLGFCIGDVSGKGIPAAIFMAVCKTALKSIALSGVSPNDCFRTINNTLVGESPSNVFVTAFYGIYNLQTSKLEYCNAGHNPIYHITSNGELKPLPEVDGIPLGFMKDFKYSCGTISLLKNETIFLYTDGVNEAMDVDENEFSDERLMETLQKFAGIPLLDYNQSVIDEVQQFTKGIPQSDDITLLSIRNLL